MEKPMTADEIIEAIETFSDVCKRAAYDNNYDGPTVIQTAARNRAIAEIKHLIAIRDDTDTAWPEKPLHNDKC